MDVEFWAKWEQLEDEKAKLMREVMVLKSKEESLESEQRNWKEESARIRKECWEAVVEKKKLDNDLEVKKLEVEIIRSLSEEKDGVIASLSEGIKALEGRNSKLLTNFEVVKKKVQAIMKALLDFNNYYEEDKKKIMEELEEMAKYKSLVEGRNYMIATLLVKNDALDNKRSFLEKKEVVSEERILELLKKIEVLERTFEVEIEEAARKEENLKASEAKIEALRSLLEIKDVSIRMMGESNERLGSEKKKIEEAFKRFMGATCSSHGDLQSSALKEGEKMAMEAKEKEISELARIIHNLETEKEGLEEEIMQKAEAMKVILEENDRLEDQIKTQKLETKKWIVKSEEGVELSQGLHLANNVGLLGAPLHIEGPKMEDQMASGNSCKSKRPLPEKSDGGRSCDDAISLGSYGKISTTKRFKISIKKSRA